ncbi:sensor histidine kinase [Novosphingobium percolationis]|uniref:sensor histidine kinase n=1 Tax=Novosphingobium percolationis TaxID=2871811 RepID=UPI001CD7A0D9|nr:ATP-binding protein [Novosphingobium percolationis]
MHGTVGQSATAQRERPRRPGLRLLIESHLLFALFLVALLAALSIPVYGISASREGAAILVTLQQGHATQVPPETPVRIAAGAWSIEAPARTFQSDFVPDGDRAAVARFYAERDAIVALASAPGATVTVAGAAAPLAPAHRRLMDLPHNFWLLSLQAVVIGLLGAWVRTSAVPGDLRARMFGLSCAGVAMAGLSGAVFDTRDLTAPGDMLRAMMTLNVLGSNVSAVALLALFLYTPRTLAPRWIGPVLVAAGAVAGVLQGLAVLPLESFYALLVLPTLGLPLLLLVQYRRAAGDAGSRATLRWIGATTFAGGAFVTIGMAAPVLLGVPSLGSDGSTIVPLLMAYGGIAFGIAGRRLFVLDAWSYRLALGAGATLALLVADALLVNLLALAKPVALALALLAVGYLYVPLRGALWSRINRSQALTGPELFRMAGEVAFAPDTAQRRAAWRTLLDRLYQPLEIGSAPMPVPVPQLLDGGEALALPAAAGESALLLRHAGNGAKLFTPADLATSRELVALLEGAEEARAAYARGATEERRRIARDLHDDVSGLLLTGLHREDLAHVRGDVQQALGEIRAMVSSLAGHAQPLGLVLADCRYEASGRLAAAGITLDWPPDLAEDAEDRIVEYARHKALVSALREVVTNAIRHSGASRVTVSATIEGDRLSLLVRDDGRGLVAETRREVSGGNGLGNLAQRLAEIGGACTIEPSPQGFAVRLDLPLAAA